MKIHTAGLMLFWSAEEKSRMKRSKSAIAWLLAMTALLLITQGNVLAASPISVYLPLVLNPGDARPVIRSFSANPPAIQPGGTSMLSWSVTGATTLSLNPGVGAVTGTQTDVNPTVTTEYTLTASNSSGTTTAKVTVTVADEEPEPQTGATWLPFGTNPD